MAQNRRREVRHRVLVKVDYRTVGNFITDYTSDFSKGGLFVKTSMPLDVGERVRLRLSLPGEPVPFALDGVVRWNSPLKNRERQPPGMGVEFTGFDDKVRGKIATYVQKLDRPTTGPGGRRSR